MCAHLSPVFELGEPAVLSLCTVGVTNAGMSTIVYEAVPLCSYLECPGLLICPGLRAEGLTPKEGDESLSYCMCVSVGRVCTFTCS